MICTWTRILLIAAIVGLATSRGLPQTKNYKIYDNQEDLIKTNDINPDQNDNFSSNDDYDYQLNDEPNTDPEDSGEYSVNYSGQNEESFEEDGAYPEETPAEAEDEETEQLDSILTPSQERAKREVQSKPEMGEKLTASDEEAIKSIDLDKPLEKSKNDDKNTHNIDLDLNALPHKDEYKVNKAHKITLHGPNHSQHQIVTNQTHHVIQRNGTQINQNTYVIGIKTINVNVIHSQRHSHNNTHTRNGTKEGNGSPSGGSPAGGSPAGGSPGKGSPAGGSPGKGSPAGGSPAGGSPAGGSPAGGSPAGGSPGKGSPAGGSPAGGSPAGGSPAGGSPAGGSPAGGSSAGGSPAGGSPAGGSPAGDSPAGGSPAEGSAAIDHPAGKNKAAAENLN